MALLTGRVPACRRCCAYAATTPHARR
jgi:hypothetical protein